MSQPLVQEHQDRPRARSEGLGLSGSPPHFLPKPNQGRIRASSSKAGAASAVPRTKATLRSCSFPSLCPRVLPRPHSPSPWPSGYLRHRRHHPGPRSVAQSTPPQCLGTPPFSSPRPAAPSPRSAHRCLPGILISGQLPAPPTANCRRQQLLDNPRNLRGPGVLKEAAGRARGCGQ